MELSDILKDREKYPDDKQITLADGVETTLGELRNGFIPKGDFTRYTETAKARERQLQQGLDAANANLARALEERKAQEDAGRPTPGARPTEEMSIEDLAQDAVLGKLARTVLAQQEELTAAKASISNHEQTWTRASFMGSLNRLKAADPDLDTDALLTYSQRFPVIDMETKQVDLDRTYEAFSRSKAVDRARKEGEEAGIVKGREAAKVPPIPFGRRFTPPSTEGLPAKSLQELTDDQVLADPEMQQALTGDHPG